MANVTLWGASYTDVPAVTLPQTGGGTVTFYENGGGGVTVNSLSVTENGTYTAPTGTAYSPVTVNVSGGGGGNEDAILERTLSGNYENTTITKIGNALCYQSGLTSVNLPNVTNGITNELLRGCSNLTTIYMPKLSGAASSGNYAFAETKIATIALPGWTTNMGNRWFNGCSSLTTVDLATRKLGNDDFYNCSSLTTLILRNSSLVAANSSSFGNSPAASGGAGITVYIPKSLYDHLGDGTSFDYQSATNWATVYGYGTITFAKIEGSQYENYYADGTPIPTS